MYYLFSSKNSSEEQFRLKKINKIFLIVILSCFFIAGFVFIFFNARAAELSNYSVTISDSRPSQTNVSHNYQWSGSSPGALRCITLESCTTYTGACNVLTGLDTTGAAKGAFSGLTQASWTLDATTNGKLQLTNAAGETPSANVSLQFSGIDNPTIAGLSIVRIKTFSDVSCSTQVDYGYASFQTQSGISVTATITPPPTTANVIFIGKSSPLALITILNGNSVISTFQAGSDGSFSKSLTALAPGMYTFGIFGEDRSSARTTVSYYTLNLTAGTTTTVSGIFLSPTVSLSPARVYKGASVTILGEGYPGSLVNIYLLPGNILKQSQVNLQGFWSYNLDTSFLGTGNYSVTVMEISQVGEHSAYSSTFPFTVVPASARGREPSTPTTPAGPAQPPIIHPPVEGLLIYSPTHPDQKDWYNKNDVTFNWSKGPGVTDFSYLLDENPYTVPDDISEGSNNSVTYNDLGDGVWYFHLKAKKDGSWWKVAHFLIKIDTTPPAEFLLSINPSFRLPFFRTLFTLREKPFAVFFAADKTSGVDHYEIKYDDITWWRIDKKQGEFELAESPYQLPRLGMGRYLVIVRAFDAAGNFEDKSQGVIVVSIWLIIIIIFLISGIVGGIIWWVKRKNTEKVVAESGGFTSTT